MEEFNNVSNTPEEVCALKCIGLIQQALLEASHFGLEVDVMHTAMTLIKNQPEMEIEDAVREAMVEWDVW
jgi:hypothetical protein